MTEEGEEKKEKGRKKRWRIKKKETRRKRRKPTWTRAMRKKKRATGRKRKEKRRCDDEEKEEEENRKRCPTPIYSTLHLVNYRECHRRHKPGDLLALDGSNFKPFAPPPHHLPSPPPLCLSHVAPHLPRVIVPTRFLTVFFPSFCVLEEKEVL